MGFTSVPVDPDKLLTARLNTPLDFILPALHRLDLMLDCAVRNMQAPQQEAASFRGLYISGEEVAHALSQSPEAMPFAIDPAMIHCLSDTASGQASPLTALIRHLGLSQFEADLIILALAPEINLRYEKVFAYLQDDVTRKRPTVELALNLLCSSAEEKLLLRNSFSLESPLFRNGLARLIPDPNQVEPPLLAYYLRLDDQVVRQLLGDPALDSRLAPFCEIVRNGEQDASPLGAATTHTLAALIQQSREHQQSLRLYFQGADGIGKRQTAASLAAASSAELLMLDSARLLEHGSADDLLKVLVRELRMRSPLLYISSLDDVRQVNAAHRLTDLLDMIAEYEGVTILAGRSAWVPGTANFGIKVISFDALAFEESQACWKKELQALDVPLDERELETLSSRFRLTSAQIKSASASAVLNSRWKAAAGDDSAAPSLEDLCASARGQCGYELGRLAKKIEPNYTWKDIILPPDPTQQLREICAQAEYRQLVFGTWGFDSKLSLGKGLNILFSGPPGTGKTMAAEVIARHLHLDLYRIDLSQVVSKYIGESEKNLDKIFTAAESSNAILFFDEADSLFGKRSEVRDSHDRYANLEVSYLLQKMEEYQGTSILATNLKQNLDEAFMRRLQAVVEFPFPDEQYRTRIWQCAFPTDAPVDADVDFALLGRSIPLAGGNIKNMALAAAFYAASDGESIGLRHLVRAAHREHQKIGRSWDGGELPHLTLLPMSA